MGGLWGAYGSIMTNYEELWRCCVHFLKLFSLEISDFHNHEGLVNLLAHGMERSSLGCVRQIPTHKCCNNK